MKKFVSIALAIVMMLSVSVCAFAAETDDEYINSTASEILSVYEHLFPMDNGWWSTDSELTTDYDYGTEFAAAVVVDGAKIVVKADAIAGSSEDGYGYQYGIQTTDSWQTYLAHFNYPDEEPASDTIYLMAAEDVVIEGDYAYIIIDAAEFVALMAEHGDDISTCSFQWVDGACSGAKTYGVYVITTGSSSDDSSAEADTTSEEASSETSEASESSESTESASSPDTGVALALLPMAIAGIAVVSSKRK
ncbi:MAG: hypothetical protein LUE20_02920 [Oscillospiraceae bacterium]|nr:hypothetical protein [Oscillospiraceae bacterium]